MVNFRLRSICRAEPQIRPRAPNGRPGDSFVDADCELCCYPRATMAADPISAEALALARDSEIIDLHVDTFILAVQGGNCFDAPSSVGSVPEGLITRVTLVHLTSSPLGATSSPLSKLRSKGRRGLSAEGRELVQALDAARIFVDLAHIHP